MSNFRYTAQGKVALDALKQMAELEVGVGFQSGAVDDKGTPIVNIAYWNHFGTHKPDGSVHIPSRPFMDALKNHKSKVDAFTSGIVAQVCAGQMDAQSALNAIGSYCKGLIQEEIRNGDYEPNAQFTVDGGWMRNPWNGKIFYAEGKHSTKPLIDTGYMRQNVTFVVRGGKK